MIAERRVAIPGCSAHGANHRDSAFDQRQIPSAVSASLRVSISAGSNWSTSERNITIRMATSMGFEPEDLRVTTDHRSIGQGN